MTEHILQISDDFWNIRGEFKLGGVLDIGTHASLVKLASGKFVLLDSYTLQGEVKSQVDTLTNDGKDIEAIIHLHPFHTVHTKTMHQQYPNARLYGTRRHVERFSELPWQNELTESAEFAALYADDFEFSVPAGVDFISSNEHLHFASVLAYHKSSRTIHSDDTLMYLRLPGILGRIRKPTVKFHPTLPHTLEKRQGAAQEFREWASALADRWQGAQNLCAAHSDSLLRVGSEAGSLSDRIRDALRKTEKTLIAHEKKFG